MSSPYVAQLMLVGFTFPPTGWASTTGQLLAISSNTALFSLLGVQFGGDGRSNFGLPNMQGNLAMGMGQGPGLSPHVMGEQGGEATISLIVSEVPQHNHSVYSAAGRSTASSPAGNSFADAKEAAASLYTAATTPVVSMAPTATSTFGGNQPHNNLMPYLCLNWVIALNGVYPPRS